MALSLNAQLFRQKQKPLEQKNQQASIHTLQESTRPLSKNKDAIEAVQEESQRRKAEQTTECEPNKGTKRGNNNDQHNLESPLSNTSDSAICETGCKQEDKEDLTIEIKKYQTHILMLQGKAYLELRKPKHAIRKLQTALKLNKHFYGELHPTNASIYTILSQVHTRSKNFQKALEYLHIVLKLTEDTCGAHSPSLASVHLQLAEVFAKQKNLEDAAQNQKRAYDIFSGLNNNQSPDSQVSSEFVASVALTLSEWLEKLNKIIEALQYLNKVQEIYTSLYGLIDDKTIKVKKSIGLLLLKVNDYQKSLSVLKEVQSVQKSLYGEDSLEVGKTSKVIGTIEIILNNPKDARESLSNASVIFKLKGQHKLEKETLTKLKMLHKSLPDDLVQPIMSSEEQTSNIKEDSQIPKIDKKDCHFKIKSRQISPGFVRPFFPNQVPLRKDLPNNKVQQKNISQGKKTFNYFVQSYGVGALRKLKNSREVQLKSPTRRLKGALSQAGFAKDRYLLNPSQIYKRRLKKATSSGSIVLDKHNQKSASPIKHAWISHKSKKKESPEASLPYIQNTKGILRASVRGKLRPLKRSQKKDVKHNE